MHTIDQCQGAESDIVVLSLVQKPTKFLNQNRFNVALSRVRQKLFLLCDKNQFKRAANDMSWDCASLAQELLQLASRPLDGNDSDEYSTDSGEYY